MTDSRQHAPPTTEQPPQIIRLADYRVPDFLIDRIELTFDLGEEETSVVSRLEVRRNPASGAATAPLRLDGEELRLVALYLDGAPLVAESYRVDAKSLVIPDPPAAFTLQIETRIRPQDNTELSGLYKSGGNFCTQCEAEGFRRITYMLDRPDVMAVYKVTITADAEAFPVLLSNGNRTGEGALPDGRHFVTWHDPHPKPSYLFALVAGKLVATRDTFRTRSGRDVDLAIWVRAGDEDRCFHAMAALKAAMLWDEEIFGLEYDLDIFNIVAVSDFNMGAMENKSLNVFNTKYVLAKPETATDFDYQGIETVVAHEYFHNWTGNRVTCRDWFQLSLKEGLTVFRDQEFSADQGSPAVKRILDVRRLRAAQFPEDDGPLAHPVRPDSYMEINNFYTATVYQKGAEIVRLIHTLLGVEGFRRGMDLYFARHDNSAVRIEDFVSAMQDASGVDLQSMKLWYTQSGTPELEVTEAYDPQTRIYLLTLRQSNAPTPGQPAKLPLFIPVAMALLGPDGGEQPSRLADENAAITGTRILPLAEAAQTFTFVDVPAHPTPSLLRGFSAPVKLRGLGLDQLRFLFAHDPDPFARWEAGQQVATKLLLDLVTRQQHGESLELDDGFVAAIAGMILGADADPAFAAEAISMPGESFLNDQMKVLDVDAVHAVRQFARAEIGTRLWPDLLAAYHRLTDEGAYRIDGHSIGRRALRNAILAYLVASGRPEAVTLAKAQFDRGHNMTDTLAALSVLAETDEAESREALAAFYAAWRHDDLVLDKWFAIQAGSPLPGAISAVRALLAHPDFDPKNPNRMRALIGTFSMVNLLRFHDRSGAGYELLAEQIIQLDGINSQMAARLTVPLGMWRRQDGRRQDLMRQALQRILAQPGLSKGTFEMASKSLG